MNTFYGDLSTFMYPSTLLHRFGVNGKVSGSVGAVGEMRGVAAIVHGPRGCGFHYRNSARRRHQLFDALYSSDLREEDIILGGEEKLRQTVVDVYSRHRPPLIAVIPTPVGDILNDDVVTVARQLRKEMNIPVIAMRSELFSHRDKQYLRKRVREIAKQPLKGAKNLEMELLGCGFTETLYALVDQVMQPQHRDSHCVNIETVGWGAQGKQALGEIEKFLNTCGIRVGCWIPSSTLKELEAAPRAQLNIVKRVRWARYMKEKFGTDYLHLGGAGRHHGLSGIVRFYQDIADALNLYDAVQPHLELALSSALTQVQAAKKYLGQFNCALVCRGIQMAPYILRQYAEDYGLNIRHLCLILTEEDARNMELDQEVRDRLMEKIEQSAMGYDLQIHMNANPDKLRDIFSSVDFVAGTQDMTLEGMGAPVIPSVNETTSLSFESYVRSVRRLRDRVQNAKERRHLLVNAMGFDPAHYPLSSDKYSLAAREMWLRMWLTRKEAEQ